MVELRMELNSDIRNSFSSRMNSLSLVGTDNLSISDSQMLEYIENVEVAQSGDAGDQLIIEEGVAFDDLEEVVKPTVHPLPEDAHVIPIDGNLRGVSEDSGPTDSLSSSSEMAAVSAMHKKSNDDVEAQKQQGKRQKHEKQKTIPKMLMYASITVHLAVFGILGVLARYGMKKLFGPNGVDVTRDRTPLYPDLPANMLACFLMGWMGVEFKDDLRRVSESLAIGLTTGFLGSLSTISVWTQDMLVLSVERRWAAAAVELVIGLLLVFISIVLGVRSAKGFRWILNKNGYLNNNVGGKMNSFKSQKISLLLMLFALICLWTASGELFRVHLKASLSSAELWLAFLVGPVGVWLRWRLARLNGRGLGKSGRFNWIPFGTLATNMLAAALMPSLATIELAIGKRRGELVGSGIEMGFLGCLGTVSTFAAEIYAMAHSKHSWRADVYTALTIGPSLILGTLIYSVSVWIKHYTTDT